MIQLRFVKSDDVRIAQFESLIKPEPKRIDKGYHIIFEENCVAIGYLHVLPFIWIGGEIIAIEKSHWIYVARLAFKNVDKVALSLRRYYKTTDHFLFPLTLLIKPTPGHSEDFNTRLGYSKDKWLPEYWTKNCLCLSDLPLAPKSRPSPLRPKRAGLS